MAEEPTNQSHFSIAYDGPLVARGFMDAGQFGASLIGVGKTVVAANSRLNGSQAKVNVQVQAQFKKGSFIVDLHVMQMALEVAQQSLTAEHIRTANEILKLIGWPSGIGGGLLLLIKWLRGRRPKKVEQRDPQTINITNIDGDQITIHSDVYHLYTDRTTRQAIAEMVEPVRSPGIDSFSFHPPEGEDTVITQEDAPAFEIREEREEATLLQDVVQERFVEILKPAFDPDLTWRFQIGKSRFDMYVRDQKFQGEVEAGRWKFGAHYAMRANVRTRTFWTTAGIMDSKMEVIEVLEILPPPEQIPLIKGGETE